MKEPIILIMEVDLRLRPTLQTLAERQGCRTLFSTDAVSTLRYFHPSRVQLVLLGSSPNGIGEGIEVATQIRRQGHAIPIIFLARRSSEDLAIAALKAGANDYFKSPFSFVAIQESIAHYLSLSVSLPWTARQRPDPEPMEPAFIVGESITARNIHAYLAKVAATNSNVLITGETGTGKELVANYIHAHSQRQQQPLIDINCAAIPDSLLESELFGYEKGAFTGASSSYEGKLRLAHGGTLFLDEIGDMSPYAQAKILRAIERRQVQSLGAKRGSPVDIRVMAATNQDLDQLMGEGRFRKDLYYRLNVTRVHLPPLRERQEDIPVLSAHYIQEFNRQFQRQVHGFTDEALECLLRYDWPGNIRELRNLIEAIFVNDPPGKITLEDFPLAFRKPLAESTALPPDERAQLLASLLATNWNKSKAAQQLHWSRVTLYRKMWKYRLVSKGETKMVQHIPTATSL